MSEAQFSEPALIETEDVLGIFYGGPRAWGGKLIVTNRRLIFAPIDLRVVELITKYVADKAGVPGADLADQIIDQVKLSVRKELWLRHITSIEPNGDGGWFSAPGIRMVTATGEVVEFGIVISTLTRNNDPGNPVVRDQAIALIRAATAAASQAPA
jgi:hypothetical protein